MQQQQQQGLHQPHYSLLHCAVCKHNLQAETAVACEEPWNLEARSVLSVFAGSSSHEIRLWWCCTLDICSSAAAVPPGCLDNRHERFANASSSATRDSSIAALAIRSKPEADCNNNNNPSRLAIPCIGIGLAPLSEAETRTIMASLFTSEG